MTRSKLIQRAILLQGVVKRKRLKISLNCEQVPQSQILAELLRTILKADIPGQLGKH